MDKDINHAINLIIPQLDACAGLVSATIPYLEKMDVCVAEAALCTLIDMYCDSKDLDVIKYVKQIQIDISEMDKRFGRTI